MGSRHASSIFAFISMHGPETRCQVARPVRIPTSACRRMTPCCCRRASAAWRLKNGEKMDIFMDFHELLGDF